MIDQSPKVYIIHENPEWAQPLTKALEDQHVPFEEWLITDSSLDLQGSPPEGVFYCKMSASAHSRGHGAALAFAASLVQWLEVYGRRVINGGETLQTEVSKARQYVLLNRAGIRTPRTIVANSHSQLLAAAKQLDVVPFILKPNCGGKGLGVRLIPSVDALAGVVEGSGADSADGIFIVQEYIKPVQAQIVRMEFIARKLHYAVAVDTSEGFELCPADTCEIPASEERLNGSPRHKFEILPDFHIPEIAAIERFLTDQQIDIAGIEYAQNEEGARYFYDINTNTNYNEGAERRAHAKPGIEKVAEMLQLELQKYYPEVASGGLN